MGPIKTTAIFTPNRASHATRDPFVDSEAHDLAQAYGPRLVLCPPLAHWPADDSEQTISAIAAAADAASDDSRC